MFRVLLVIGIASSFVTGSGAQEPAPTVTRESQGGTVVEAVPQSPGPHPGPPKTTQYLPPGTTQYQVELLIIEGKSLFAADARELKEQVGVDANTPVSPSVPHLKPRPVRTEPAPAQFLERPVVDGIEAPDPALLKAAKSDGTDLLWDEKFRSLQGVTVLASPTVITVAKRPATVQMGHAQIFTYLHPVGGGKFERKVTARKELGMKFHLVVEPVAGDDQFVMVSPLEIQVAALDGREPVVGLEDIEAGEPIIAERSLKTTAKLRLGETREIRIPSGPKREAFLMLRVRLKPRGVTVPDGGRIEPLPAGGTGSAP